MAVVKGAAIEGFLKQPPAAAAAVLLYGSDSGLVRERAQRLVRAVAGSLDDPFTVVRLEEANLAADPGRLADEFNAIAMLGGRRAVWVTEADKAFLKAVEPLLESPAAGNLIIAESGNLAKTSPLRSLIERAPSAYAIAAYEDTEEDLRSLIAAELAVTGVQIDPDAEKLLVSLLSGDRQLSRSELGKLAVYGIGRSVLTIADIEAVCGDVAARSIDDVIDAVFEGDLEACDKAYARVIDSGATASAVLTMMAMHIARLQQLRIEIDAGKSPEEAVRAARPPIFFKKAGGVVRQLRLWDIDALVAAGASVAQATRASRSGSELDEAITGRTLLALARTARQTRLGRY